MPAGQDAWHSIMRHGGKIMRWRQGKDGLVCALVALLLAVSRPIYGGDPPADLRSVIVQQGKEIEELQKQLDAKLAARAGGAADPAQPQVDATAVQKIVADYLHENPGAGMPSSVQSGYSLGNGFFVRSAPNPNYVRWDDECKIPFELRVRGRL